MDEPMELRPVVRQSESRPSRVGPFTSLRYQLFDRYRTDTTQTSRFSAMTTARTAATAPALTATLGRAAASWVVAVRQLNGMDMGVATQLGSFAFFVGLWVIILTGLSGPATKTLVGVERADLRQLRSAGDFQSGLELAEHLLGSRSGQVLKIG